MRRRAWHASILAAAAVTALGVSMAAAQDEPQVPPWVRTLAAAWSDGHVSDAEFVAAMGFLVNHGVVPAPNLSSQGGAQFALADHVHDNDHYHDSTLFTLQDGVTYGDSYVHYFERRSGPIADIAVPDEEGKCFDRLGKVRTPTITLKFKPNPYARAYVELTGAGIGVDTENRNRLLWYQLFNETHSVSPVRSVGVADTGLQVDAGLWPDHRHAGRTYEIRSVYGEQCGRSAMVMGY